MPHAKEPWKVSAPWKGHPPRWLVMSGKDVVADCDVTSPVNPDCEANARRIAACVNACEGLLTQTLEAASLDVTVGRLMYLETVCVRLVEAYDAYVEQIVEDDSDFDSLLQQIGDELRAALAACAKGRK